VSNAKPETRYHYDDKGDFVITNYLSSKLFSSFFPGIAGKLGMPMWTFYVNRGQCVCSMGVEGKHRPIMEFLPANWAYNLVSTQGFRTFVKLPDHPSISFYEPFQNDPRDAAQDRVQRMIISPAALTLEEDNRSLGLSFKVQYFNVPQDSYAGLARRLSITNLNSQPVRLQVLDGLPLIIPYGLDDFGLKHMRRLFEAFVEVSNYERKVPFFKLKVEPADRPDVVRIKKGNFYLGFGEDGKLVDPVYDPVRVFGIRGDFSYPESFLNTAFNDLTRDQIYENRLPCAMGSFETTIAVNRTYTYSSVIGHAGSIGELNGLVPNIIQNGYIEHKAIENHQIVSELTQKSFICSSDPVLDRYARQTFLDNVLRGGFPHQLQGSRSSTTLHLYSRKHGDLERDYNDYRLTPTPFSQGNGNYRDVNQNRRCDLYYNPQVADSNVIQFYNMLQVDGFNPLVVRETRFVMGDAVKRDQVLSAYLDAEHRPQTSAYLGNPFTPGELLIWLKEQHIPLRGDPETFIGDLLEISSKRHDTDHAEGFWVDHWTYNLDLLENYLALYPEHETQLLFEKAVFTFYDNSHRVRPRDDKYVLWDGKPMQLNAVVRDEEKEQLIRQRAHDPNLLRTDFGKGAIYRGSLLVKLLSLIANKLASLDPEGAGVEMEADKPGWYDALNGLPGLIGSSICETLELKRHILYLLKVLKGLPCEREFSVFIELNHFIRDLHSLLELPLSAFDFWNRAATLKESYRSQTRLGINGAEGSLGRHELVAWLESALAKLERGIDKAWDPTAGVISTYFFHEVLEYEPLLVESCDGHKTAKLNSKGFPCIKPLKFKQHRLPLFLEGPVHFLRCMPEPELAGKLADNVRASGLFDHKLGMYKVNASLADQAMEIGRARTFSPGWFENESIWLHMEYKYMLELLRNGLYEQFFRDFKTVFIPFLDPAVYGRSTLENSSFIVSSANPDPSLHGNGFVARLSGATAEWIHIIHLMTVGQRPFDLDDDGRLKLSFAPVLPGWLFSAEAQTRGLYLDGVRQELEFPAHSFSFMFLSDTLVSFHNPSLKDSFGPAGVKPVLWKLVDRQGQSFEHQGPSISGPLAELVRDGKIRRIEIELR